MAKKKSKSAEDNVEAVQPAVAAMPQPMQPVPGMMPQDAARHDARRRCPA